MAAPGGIIIDEGEDARGVIDGGVLITPGIPGKGGCGKWLTAFWLYTTFRLLLLLLERPSVFVADEDFSVAFGEAEVLLRSAAKAASLEKTNSDTIFLTSFEAGGGVADVVSASLLSADLIPDVEESLWLGKLSVGSLVVSSAML